MAVPGWEVIVVAAGIGVLALTLFLFLFRTYLQSPDDDASSEITETPDVITPGQRMREEEPEQVLVKQEASALPLDPATVQYVQPYIEEFKSPVEEQPTGALPRQDTEQTEYESVKGDDITSDPGDESTHNDDVGEGYASAPEEVLEREEREQASPCRERDSPTRERDSPTRERDSPTRERESPTRDRESPLLERSASIETISSDCSVFESLVAELLPGMGQLEFTLEYDAARQQLLVTVIQAQDLAIQDYQGPIDSFVKIFLHPNNEPAAQSKVYRKSPNPVFNERFIFHVREDDLDSRILQFCVYAYDKFSRQRPIGEAELKLCDVDVRLQPFSTWCSLQDINQKPAEFGDILFSISYLPTAERLTVVIVKCRNLVWVDEKDDADPFVKVYLLQNGKKISKKKTSVKRSERCPIYNEAMIFNVPANALQTISLRITVSEHTLEGKTPSIGHVIVGPASSGLALSHWNQMMTSLRKPVAMWHPLRK
ncbi:PREDICTED: synaptotagmin-12-like [Branchiostoma belcheri]|uniref:Synaptotagmin-12-like n=1 Tax=Branchiostoma belcheri TaxID=7741 RepID=A0A6P4Y943_BRABE|nr:PREDICTED: synaptotagmin-12-like [Branchiostoma belcheri]